MKTVSTTSHLVTFKGKMIRFMFSFILLSLIIHLLAVKASAVDVTLQWDTNADAEYYVVYYGTTSGNYTQNSANITAPAVEHTVTGLDETTWYFSVKAFNSCGNSSDFSDEIVYTSVYSPLSISIESPILYANITQGQSVNFQSLISGGAAPLSYSWNFGTGGPVGSSVEDPGNVTFANPGMYTVTLTVTDANNEVQTATVIVTVEQIYVDVTPTAQISSPSVDVSITEGDAVQFEGLVTNGNAAFTYYWNFGAAEISDSNVEDPGSVVFNTAGTYNVTFTVTDNDGDISSDTITVTVDERIIDVEPVAAISSPESAVTITQGGSVVFNGTVSSGNAPLAHSWDFGTSGLPSNGNEDPGSMTFSNAGTYTVTYTVTDADGDVSHATTTVTVLVPDTNPTAAMTSPSSNVTITQGGSVNFAATVTSGNAPYTHSWNFGTSGVSTRTVEDPGTLAFSTVGTFTVTYTVTDSDGDVSSATRSVTVVEPDTTPTAAITSPASSTTITQGGSVNFAATVTSGNAPYTHAWNFGTSGVASQTVEDPGNVTFTYPGLYTVTYTVTDSDGDVSSATRTVTVLVPDTNPTAAMTSPSANVTITQGGSVNFAATVTSGNAPYTHAWNFGTSGVASKTVEDPGSLAFSTVGTFTVTYTVTDNDGDVSSASRTVTVVEPDTNPTAAMTSPSANVSITQGGTVNFAATVTSGNAPYTHAWNFGNSGVASRTVEDPGSLAFSTIGTFTVTYTVTDNDGDISSATRTVTVNAPDTNPVAAMTSPSANVTITQGGAVNFAATVTSGNAPYTHAWNFGTSGVASQSVEDPGNLTFSAIGTFTVTYTVTDNDGDISSATRTVTVTAPDTNPVAAMTSPSANVTITQGGAVNFAATVTSGNAPYTHAWNFGTSGVASQTVEDPGSVTFSTIGTFTVIYTVTDSDGDTNSATRTVTVTAPDTNPVAAISSPSANVSIAQGGSVSFAATVTGGNAPYTHAWNFGTSGVASQSVEDPGSLTFGTMGTFTVTYTVTDNDGDAISATRIVTVSAADTNPTAAISSPSANVSIVQGGSVSFAATVTGGNAPYTHAWSFGTSGVASKTVEDPGSLVFSTAGTFTATYTVTDSDGDINSATRTVTVTASNADLNPVATITTPASNLSIAQGASVNFQGTVESGNAPYRYRWNFGWGGPAYKTVEDPGSVAFRTAGTYLVSFIVMDKDRDVSTDTVVVTVSSKSSATIEKASLTTPANGSQVSITPKLIADAGDIDGDTQWQISTNAAFTDVVLDVTQKIGSAELDVPSQVLDGSTTYYWRMKHNSIKSEISNWSDARSFTTVAPAWNDQNGNGVPDTQETEDDIDLNNDGEVDHNQDILKTVRSYNGKASFGLVKIENVLDIEILEAMNDEAIADTTGKPGRMPSGLIGFRIITENPGDSVLIGICLPEAAPANAGWFKYDTILGWQDYSSIATFSADRKNIVIELADGGDGDADGCINGVIVDPAGLGIADSDSQDNVVVGASEGAGCFISSAESTMDERAIAALGILLICAVGAVIRRKESHK